MNPITRPIDTTTTIARRFTLTGLVQGIGLRPSIARLAKQLLLTGYVGNTGEGVEIHVEGPEPNIHRFNKEWLARLPASAVIASHRSKPADPAGYRMFVVGNGPASSQRSIGRYDLPTPGRLTARVPADVVVCAECLDEVRNCQDIRHRYPFTGCTLCGPRYSIISRMPYERHLTGMSEFELCGNCRAEYESPDNRRYHSQTNACPDCGPQIWLRRIDDSVMACREGAIQAAASAILQGQIVAVRGLGGYQLMVDATSDQAVERLRERKRRMGKPLAVMVRTLSDATLLGRLDESERQALTSPAGPIVIVAASNSHSVLAEAVTSGLNTIGLMLPTTPLHWLLLDAVQRPLVCTSGNRDGEPLVFEAEQAIRQLNGIADVWLEHDRPIVRPVDDSVVRVMAGKVVGIRLARGYAPLALPLDSGESMIALGGHQKNSIAISNGTQTALGPHIGDLDTVATRQRFADQTRELAALYGATEPATVCDLHPEYFTTQWNLNETGRNFQVQHHHAHIVAGMVGHGWLDREVLGVAFDGTGYGTDGTIWGGEFLLVTTTGFNRIGHLRRFPLVGGELAIRQPWRVATALVLDAAGEEQAAKLGFRTGHADRLLEVLRRPALSPWTTSAGRLFDGVSSLILGIETCLFEGQAAMLLESVADPAATGQYELVLKNNGMKEIDWRPLVRQILRDREAGILPGTMAMRFHRGLAAVVTAVCRCYPTLPVVLGGGVFQNRLLVELLAESLHRSGQSAGLPGLIPPNDGGLAAGQLAIGLALARHGRTDSCV